MQVTAGPSCVFIGSVAMSFLENSISEHSPIFHHLYFYLFFLLWRSLSLEGSDTEELNTWQSLILITLLSYEASVFTDTHHRKKQLFPGLEATLMHRKKHKGLESSLTTFPFRKTVLALPPRPMTFPDIGCDQIYHVKHDSSCSRVGVKSSKKKKREAGNTHNNDATHIVPVPILPGPLVSLHAGSIARSDVNENSLTVVSIARMMEASQRKLPSQFQLNVFMSCNQSVCSLQQ